MKLAIFDLDGTLTITSPAGREVYNRVLSKNFGLDLAQIDWNRISHSTDSGVVHDIFLQLTGNPPQKKDLSRLRRVLSAAFSRAVAADPWLVLPLAGASAALRRLLPEAGWRPLIASGSWPETGLLKLESLGDAALHLPRVFGDVSLSRGEIIKEAIKLAAGANPPQDLKAVYLGDGVWDFHAAQRVGIGFLGVNGSGRKEELFAAGVDEVIDSYGDFGAFLEALERAS